MGALLGMVMAAQRDTPVARLVVNDAGPLIEPAALARIRDYLGPRADLRHVCGGRAYIRTVSAPFGALTDAQWEHLTRTSIAPECRRALGPDLRSRHRRALPGAAAPPDLWPLWDAIRCPTLVLRGAQSDLLSAGHCTGDDRAGSQGPAGRVPGRRPRPDAPFVRSVRSCGRIPARRSMSLSPHARRNFARAHRTIAGRLAGMVRASGGGFPRAVPLESIQSAPFCDCRSPSRYLPSTRIPTHPPEVRLAKVVPWLDEMLKKDAAAGGAPDRRRARGHQPGRDERWQAPRPRGEILGNRKPAVARARSAVRPRVASADRRCPGGGQGGADARERAVGRLQASPRERSGQAHLARRPAPHGGAGPSLPAMHGARPGQQLSVVRAGAAAHVARRASHLRVRARPQPAPRRPWRRTSPKPRPTA